MTSLKNRFCLATLVFLLAHASFLQGTGNEAAFVQDIEKQAPQLAAPQSPLKLGAAAPHDLEDARSQTNHGPSSARSILSAAVYPLDLMKKISLCDQITMDLFNSHKRFDAASSGKLTAASHHNPTSTNQRSHLFPFPSLGY